MEQEIRIQNNRDRVTLAGVLAWPETGTPTTLVILLHGTGGHTRDQVINTPLGPCPQFKLLSEYLLKSGFAVLRYDKRGAGASDGTPFPNAVIEDYKKDALAAIQFAGQQTHLSIQHLCLVGHSEGCTLAAMAASDSSVSSSVNSIALLAPPGLRGDNVWLKQQMAILKQQGLDDALLSSLDAFNRASIQALFNHPEDQAVIDELTAFLKRMPADEKQMLGIPPEGLPVEAYGELLAPRFRDFIQVDPQVYYRRITQPVLAIFGDADVQVSPSENANAVQQALFQNGNDRFDLHVLPNLNHFFFAESGQQKEQARTGEELFSMQPAQIMAEWLKGIGALGAS